MIQLARPEHDCPLKLGGSTTGKEARTGLRFEASRPELFGTKTTTGSARGRRYPAGAISGAASSAGLEVGALARFVN
jgi:hypothetical protein